MTRKQHNRMTLIAVYVMMAIMALWAVTAPGQPEPIQPPLDNLCPEGAGVPVRSLYCNQGEEMSFDLFDPDGDPITIVFLRDGEWFSVRDVNPSRVLVLFSDQAPVGAYYFNVRVTDSGGAVTEICLQIKVRSKADFNDDGSVNMKDFEQFSWEWSRLRKP